jgi:L-threonylcarbamoyladenylate synthase
VSERARIVAPARATLALAADVLRRGRLVVFPTETVYGLGASALDQAAVERIFEAKGRPPTNPVIVHVLGAEQARELVNGWDERADKLARAFWPGPLTLVLERREIVPANVAGGGSTLAVRSPSHPVARALLESFGGPIAAPSANRSTAISPTRAEHAETDLGDRVELILDGGPAEIGLESTVLSLVEDPPRLLRPGAIVASAISEVLGAPIELSPPPSHAGPKPSPGLMPRHYAPKKPLRLFDRQAWPVPATGPIAVLFRGTAEDRGQLDVRHLMVLPEDPERYAQALYAALRSSDQAEVTVIWVESPPEGEPWAAIADRLKRASLPG